MLFRKFKITFHLQPTFFFITTSGLRSCFLGNFLKVTKSLIGITELLLEDAMSFKDAKVLPNLKDCKTECYKT